MSTLTLLGGCDSSGDEVTNADDAQGPTTTDVVADTAQPEVVCPPEPRELVNGAVGVVGHIIDGDTFDIWIGECNPRVYTVRMAGLSAPECIKGQRPTSRGDWRFACTSDDEYWGLAAYEGLKSLLDERQVTISCDDTPVGAWCETDIFDRYLAYAEVDGKDAATEMARAGHGMSFTAFYASKRADICAAEYEAQDKDRGMWAAGSVSQVLNMMSSDTRGWYFAHHDRRCDEALGR